MQMEILLLHNSEIIIDNFTLKCTEHSNENFQEDINVITVSRSKRKEHKKKKILRKKLFVNWLSEEFFSPA